MQPLSGYNAMQSSMLQAPQQLQQQSGTAKNLFDDAAFEKAFDAAKEEIEKSDKKEKGKAARFGDGQPQQFHMSHACTEPGDVLGQYEFDQNVLENFDFDAFLADDKDDSQRWANNLQSEDQQQLLIFEEANRMRVQMAGLEHEFTEGKYSNIDSTVIDCQMRQRTLERLQDMVQGLRFQSFIDHHQPQLRLLVEQNAWLLERARQEQDLVHGALEAKNSGTQVTADTAIRSDYQYQSAGDLLGEQEQSGYHPLQDYQMQLRLLEEVNAKKRLMAHQGENTDLPRIGSDTIAADQKEQQGGLDADREADELSRTAGQLLDNLKDEQNQKFQKSNFLELMRQLRDKEVRVDGDKMVSVSPSPFSKTRDI